LFNEETEPINNRLQLTSPANTCHISMAILYV
jgi:hypothetical protein